MRRSRLGFWAGFASALDFFGLLYDPAELRDARRRLAMSREKALRDARAEDARKIAGDWRRVGDDLRRASRRVR
jgi:hypothetical protein